MLFEKPQLLKVNELKRLIYSMLPLNSQFCLYFPDAGNSSTGHHILLATMVCLILFLQLECYLLSTVIYIHL